MSNITDRPVVVGIDGSPDARRALCLAGEIALGLGTRLVIVHAVGLTDVVEGRHVVSEQHHDEIAQQFSSWCDAVRTVGVSDWDERLVQGAPVDTVLRVAEDDDAGLIVIGRQGAGSRPEMLLGSTAHQVVEHSTCPVLVVPPIGRTSRPAAG